MELEQVIKKMEWLDEEHRKDKILINQLSEQINNFESKIKLLSDKQKLLTKENSLFSSLPKRINQSEKKLELTRDDLIKKIDTLGDKFSKANDEFEKKINLEINGLNKSLKLIQKTTDLKEIKQQMNIRIQEEKRINKFLNLLDGNISKEKNKNNELQLSLQIIEDNQKQENKKGIDFQNNISIHKKKIDELRNKVELIPENIRRIETRLTELISSESERRYSQKTFLEQQALQQIDRDQIQNSLRDKIEQLGTQSEQYETQLHQWDSIQREVRQAQDVYKDLTPKFERRINEITEMQRLSEDRFRQEWATFKADYQKRWTSYSLSQDELFGEMNSEVNDISEKLAPIEDLTQIQQDIIQQTRDAHDEYYQGILAQINQLLSTYNRIMGSSKK